MNGIGSSKFINNTAQLAAQYNDFYLEITSPRISQIGNYKIIKEIGEGSFGKAYLATHVLLNINVVLKCGLIDDPNIVREIYYHKQLKHKNIVSLYEVIKTESHLWIALEYCQGGELYYYIYEKKRLELEECRNIFFQIVLAVKYVHSLNLSHRDLKLENILLADKKKSIVKLTDFGFIREFNPQSRKFLSTICGTTVYMAPEMLSHQKYSGFAVDIWSMGIILYTMLNGMMPFDDDNEMKIQEKIIQNEPMVYDHVPIEVNMLIMKMLNKDPNQRPSLNEILNSSFLIDTYNKHLERNSRRSGGGSGTGSGGDTESILSINQHYNSIDHPFESKIERDLLRKLQRIDFDIDELQATANNHEINLLTAFYELLLTQEFSKKKKRYYKERKRKLYEAKNSLRKSRKRVKSVLSLSEQSLVGSQPLERIMSSLSLASGKASNRTPTNITRKSTDRGEAPIATQLPKSSQTSRLNFEVPSPRATTTNTTLAPRSRRNSKDFSTAGPTSNTDVTAPLRRTVSFVPDERRLSAVIAEEKEANKKSNKSGKILNKLQFWKKNKEESIDDTISRYSTKSNHSKSTNEKMMDTDDEKPLKINMRQNENPDGLPLECDDNNNATVVNPQPTLAQPPLLDLRRDSDPIQPLLPTGSILDMPRTPPSGETTRFARTRPSSMISQISQLSKLSQMSTMLSESELDILDETDTMDDEDYDDDVYESSINTSQDNRSQNPNVTSSSSINQSRPTGKKRPSYRRVLASDGSILTTSSLTAAGGGGSSSGAVPTTSTIPRRKNSLSRLRSNSSEDISEDSNRYSGIITDESIPIGRPVSPDLIKKRNARAPTTMPLMNGSAAGVITPTPNSFADANNNNNNSTDPSRIAYHRAPSPPIGFKFSNKPSKKMMATAVNGHHQPKAYLDTKQVEDWIHPGSNNNINIPTGVSNAFTKSSIYQPVINEEEEGDEYI
ncbi:hypothetical protein Cantr_04013 [Candida viswanathii]|uniref:non-specific serine/threonine protein kinase n=1 Tax=Candida viswanathii TaxID=5486 RepID=A0A367XNZ2_9ASCO|nr:hypothetical protein Cantr_04013 [Candida viswanathii]